MNELHSKCEKKDERWNNKGAGRGSIDHQVQHKRNGNGQGVVDC